MRSGYKHNWLTDNDQMIGISLGADFVAEHERGIERLNTILGIKDDPNVLGIERYRVDPHMDCVKLIEENRNNAALIVASQLNFHYLVGQKLDSMFSGALSIYGEQELATAWDDDSFGIRVKRPTNIKKLKRIYKAIQDKNAAVWLGGGHVFNNAGLAIAIIDVVPKESKQQMYDAHLDTKKLNAASEDAGIKQKIDELNAEYRKKTGDFRVPCGYYALSPAWNKDKASKYSVVYFLNPMEQEKNNFGWFSVEELQAWTEGKGPIIKG